MKFEIIGGGALGLLLTASLIQAGAQVQLVTRTREQAQRIHAEGLLLSEYRAAKEEYTVIEPIRLYPAVSSYEELERHHQPAEADFVLLTVKQTAITDAFASFVENRLQAGARLVCFQNGIGHIDKLAKVIPLSRMLIAVTTEGALRHQSHHVEHTGKGMTWVGSLDPIQTSEAEAEIQKNWRINWNRQDSPFLCRTKSLVKFGINC